MDVRYHATQLWAKLVTHSRVFMVKLESVYWFWWWPFPERWPQITFPSIAQPCNSPYALLCLTQSFTHSYNIVTNAFAWSSDKVSLETAELFFSSSIFNFSFLYLSPCLIITGLRDNKHIYQERCQLLSHVGVLDVASVTTGWQHSVCGLEMGNECCRVAP